MMILFSGIRFPNDFSFFDHFAAAAQFFRKILELRQTILHRQDDVFIIEMSSRLELEVLQNGGINIEKSIGIGVISQDMPSA